MQRFRSTAPLQKFVSLHAAIPNRFNLYRHLTSRIDFRQRRDPAVADWRQLAT
jgi:putative transposase